MDLYYPLMFQDHPLKNPCLLMYMTFNLILRCTHEFWPQTHLHRDVCISPNTFGIFLIWVRITWNMAFGIPWECLDLTLHYPIGVLYKEPLGYIEEEEMKSKRTIVHCYRSLLVLESASLCPLEHFLLFPIFTLLTSFLSRDGGLRWWRPRWGTQFLWFAEVPTKVVTYVISSFINRNIFSCPMMCI